ncbi:HPr family phosphocarrier protein [Janibacter alkaliphilus]|uniref:Phosphocarrier protein n=1 Tax=Janibacter alkaliphilus TaxID=1069963 RepID=A0A852X241_9MICO|nr:HPr family phosphocarrier protein [Janibacter alkaliphilus]NYG36949.1 phosphocarrier protein [Janibacter alkaliphilus]
MPSQKVVVGSAVGLHARPAGIIAEKADELDAEVTLAVEGGEPVDAASALLIMTLGAEKGTEVTVESDSQDAVETIAALVAQDLDAE